MEIAAFKVKYHLLVLTFGHSYLNLWSYRSPKMMSYEGDTIFQRWQLNSASKQVLWRNEFKLCSEASKPTSKFLFQQFSSSKSKLEDFMQGDFSFLG